VRPHVLVASVALLLSILITSCTAPGTPTLVANQAAKAAPTILGGKTEATQPPAASVTPTLTASSTTSSSQSAQVSLELAPSLVESTKLITVDIVVSGVTDLYGAEVHLKFDATLVQVEDGDMSLLDTQIVPGKVFPKGASFVALNRVDNQAGTADFAATLLNPAKPLEGEIILASVPLRVIQAGSAKVDLVQVLLATREGNPIKVVSRGTSLSVKP
jgi:hypothetical protein